jgi:ABC-type cobalamin/Fe3+-siderophores transport system ATPase subunit
MLISTELLKMILDKLNRLVDEVGSLHSPLILIIGPPASGKTSLLRQLAEIRSRKVLTLGSTLGGKLASIPHRQRHFDTLDIVRELTEQYTEDGLLLIDNIEILFDRTLKLDPLDILKRNAHARRVVAVWPGELRDGRLIYADIGHPEHQDYALEGVIPFEIQ